MPKQRTGGIIALIFGGALELVNYYPTAHSIVDSLKNAGGTGALVANWLLSPLFGLAVIFVGLKWIWMSLKSRPQDETAATTPAITNAPMFSNTFSPTFSPKIEIIPQPSEQTVRLKYAETVDVVAFVGPERPTQREVPLNHLGRLIQIGHWDGDSVEMMVDRNPPLAVDRPRHDAAYNMGGGLQAVFPGANPGSGMQIRDADFAISTDPPLLFHRFNCPRHRIDFPDRSFNVALTRVHDTSTHKRKCIVYTFRVTEV